jgi:uncharacterized protein (TIGR02001 family)
MHRPLLLALFLSAAAVGPVLAQQSPGAENQAETEVEADAEAEAEDQTEAETEAEEEEEESPLSFNLGVASDYVFRGVTQTGGDPQVFAGVDYEQNSLYAGAWASNVDFGERAELELDVYGGWKPEALGFTFDVGALFYGFPASDTGYVEAKAAATRSLGPIEAGGAFFWAPDTKGREGEGLYYEANAAMAVGSRLTLSGALGRQEDDETGAYNTWNLGAAVGLTERISFDARYHDTDTDAFGQDGEGRVVAGLKAEF